MKIILSNILNNEIIPEDWLCYIYAILLKELFCYSIPLIPDTRS